MIPEPGTVATPRPKSKVLIAQYPAGTVEVFAERGRARVKIIELPEDRGEWPLWAAGPLHPSWRSVCRWLPRTTELRAQRDAEEVIFQEYKRACSILPEVFASKNYRIALLKLAQGLQLPIDKVAEAVKETAEHELRQASEVAS